MIDFEHVVIHLPDALIFFILLMGSIGVAMLGYLCQEKLVTWMQNRSKKGIS